MSVQVYDPGEFRHRGVLLNVVETPDGCGGLNESENALAELWFSLSFMRSERSEAGGRTITENYYQLKMRHRDDVETGMRIAFAGRKFEILNLRDVDAQKRYLLCDARELTQ